MKTKKVLVSIAILGVILMLMPLETFAWLAVDSTYEKCNVLRKDEVRNFANRELLLQNAPSQDEGMFRIPKVLN